MNIDQILQAAASYEESCTQSLVKVARKSSGKGRSLSKKKDESEADSSEDVIDLTKAVDFSYSAIMREMRQHADKDQVRLFLVMYKKEFDTAVKKRVQKPEKVALQNSITKFNKKHKVKLKKKMVKNAAIAELGDAALVGKYLSDIVKFTINKMPMEKRIAALDSLRTKFYNFNAEELAKKDLPPNAVLGQCITFVKHVLFNQDVPYIRDVLNNLVRNL